MCQMCMNCLEQRMGKYFLQKRLLKYSDDQRLDLDTDGPYDKDRILGKYTAQNEVEVCWNYKYVSLANRYIQKYIEIYNPEKHETEVDKKTDF